MVDAEDGDGAKGQGHVSEDEEEEGGDLGDVGGQSVSNGLLQVIEDQPALLNTSDNGGKVVVEQDHVSGLLGDVGAGDTHGNTDVSLLQGRRVVDTISGDGNDGAHPLATLHNNQLLLGRSSSEDNLVVVHQDLVKVLVLHVLDLASVDDGGSRLPGVDVLHTAVPPGSDVLHSFLALGDDSHGSSDGFGSDRVVAGHHDDLDASRSALEHSIRNSSSWGIDHGHEADKAKSRKREVLLIRVEGISLGVPVSGQHEVAESKHPLSQTSQPSTRTRRT